MLRVLDSSPMHMFRKGRVRCISDVHALRTRCVPADLAQLVEQLSCKQQVIGSSPIVGSTDMLFGLSRSKYPAGHTHCFP